MYNLIKKLTAVYRYISLQDHRQYSCKHFSCIFCVHVKIAHNQLVLLWYALGKHTVIGVLVYANFYLMCTYVKYHGFLLYALVAIGINVFSLLVLEGVDL